MHDDKCDGCCETSCEPLKAWEGIVFQVELEDGGDDDSNQSTEEVAEDEGPWLRQRNIDGTIAQDCRSALLSGSVISR